MMETASDSRGMNVDAWRIVMVGAIAGVLGGIVLMLTEMIYGWASSAHAFWDAPMATWAWISGLNHFGEPGNHIGPIFLGFGVDLVYALIAGVIFAVILVALMGAVRMRDDLGTDLSTVGLGIAYGLVLWVIMRYGILPLRDSTKALFTTSLVSPQWVFWLAGALFGMTIGLVCVAARRAAARMRPMAGVSRLREDGEQRAAA